jgi:hypothetical protein
LRRGQEECVERDRTDPLSLFKVLQVLSPYLDEIVIVGGWVPFLYDRYGRMASPHPLPRTIDVDVVVPRRVEEHGRPTIDDLLSSAGYKACVSASEVPVVKYELASPVTEIEFLTPEIGRPGKAALAVQRGLTAQALRYLQILLENTRKMKIKDTTDGSDIDLAVKVPSPGAFVYQKGLTLSRGSRRSPAKISKDLYYIFRFLDSSGELRDSIPAEICSLRSGYPARWFRTLTTNLNDYFPESDGDGPAVIATQYSGQMPAETFRNYAHHTFRGFIQALEEMAAA